ncbi:hypothetical protein MGYG_08732 [Nannizzia gypsea CBS 118893]|uniref:Uncharacterized protein n=1 Tax=Arthroderma gypseum (strain ATCC MYA-4604 / CBS 118893) TaxID=535722 RepID=E4V6U3_ARTGP|nr:hypothetical protein MGYG_08732 [Nannizzia gypsea CBS 118893]EFQ96809.1 hypothetical protein MGYG_08732 [Nannizzia gypsea CBS 118893]
MTDSEGKNRESCAEETLTIPCIASTPRTDIPDKPHVECQSCMQLPRTGGQGVIAVPPHKRTNSAVKDPETGVEVISNSGPGSLKRLFQGIPRHAPSPLAAQGGGRKDPTYIPANEPSNEQRDMQQSGAETLGPRIAARAMHRTPAKRGPANHNYSMQPAWRGFPSPSSY